MFSVLQHNAPLSPMPAEMFECFKKHLPPEERKKFEKRHQELKKIEAAREYQKELKLSEILDSETLMRFAYVPFVVAQLAWDYADTIINVSSILKLDSTKKLCLAVRELKRRYDNVRAEFTNNAHLDSEFDLNSEYPQLDSEYRSYLLAIYQCHIVLQSIYRYTEMQKVKIEKIVGHRIGDVLPAELRKLDILVMAFVGDKPVSSKFDTQQKTYAQCIANRMSLIELCDTKDTEDAEQ